MPSSRPSAGPSSGRDFAVLPGESLAKYRGANIQPLDEAEEEEIRGLQESDEGAEQEAEPVEASPAALDFLFEGFLKGEGLDINLSGSVAVGGCLSYVAVPAGL